MNEATSTLMRWDFNTETFTPYFKFPNAFSGIYSVFAVQKNVIICFSANGLFIYNTCDDTYQEIRKKEEGLSTKIEDQLLLTDNGVLVKDDGTILLLERKRIYRLKPKPQNKVFFKETINGIAINKSFRGLAEDSENNIYVTYYTAEIAEKKAGAKNFNICKIPKNPKIKWESTFSLTSYKDSFIWNNTLLNLKKHTIKPLSKTGSYSHTVQFLKGDSLWFYTWFNSNLEFYNLATNQYKSYSFDVSEQPEVRFDLINAFAEDPKGKNLYVASQFNGIFIMTKKGKVIKNYNTAFLKTIKEIGVTDLYSEPPILWYAGANGIGALNMEDETLKVYKFPDGMENNILSNRKVYFIVPLSNDEFYLGTDNGLIRFNKKTGKYFKLIKGHPLANVEFNRNSYLKASDGRYYMGTMTNLYSFFPKDLEWNMEKEKGKNIRFNLISIIEDTGKQRYISEGVNQLNTIFLSPNDASVEIYYAALQEEVEVLYSHRIKGVNALWSDYSKERKLNLVGLAPGTYNLEFRTANSPQNIRALAIQKAQYWYLRWYSQLFFITLLILLISLLIRYRYRLRLEKERELVILRNKISSDLHDDVGSILTAVAMQSELLGKHALSRQSKKLQRIGSLSRETMGRMRDTVWSIDSKKDSMQCLTSRMKDFAVDIFQDNDQFSFHFIEENEVKAVQSLNPLIRQNVYFIFKEALTNCLKHCKGDKVEVTFMNSKTELTLKIVDNGCYNPNLKNNPTGWQASGLGIDNMKARAKRMNGKLTFDSQDGFAVHLWMPLV